MKKLIAVLSIFLIVFTGSITGCSKKNTTNYILNGKSESFSIENYKITDKKYGDGSLKFTGKDEDISKLVLFEVEIKKGDEIVYKRIIENEKGELGKGLSLKGGISLEQVNSSNIDIDKIEDFEYSALIKMKNIDNKIIVENMQLQIEKQ
ncbi:MAG: hypothetical protein ACERKV_08980 [Clostridiaceae bacterium]